MPALKPTTHYGKTVWMGVVAEPNSMRSTAQAELAFDFAGPVGEGHAGLTRKSCVRVTAQHPQGTEIANVRQISIVSKEELDQIAVECGLESIDPIWLGATLVVSGIPDFTNVPPSSRLQGPDGMTLVVDMVNRPCRLPGDEIEKDQPGHGRAFKAAANGRRGVTAWVERPGKLIVGDQLRLHVPDQRAWAG